MSAVALPDSQLPEAQTGFVKIKLATLLSYVWANLTNYLLIYVYEVITVKKWKKSTLELPCWQHVFGMPQTGQPADPNSRTKCKQVNKELHITNVREMPMVRVSKTYT